MAIKRKLNFNTDKLRICYKQPEGLFEKLSTTTDKYIEFEDFALLITEDGRNENSDKEPTNICARVIMSDDTYLGDFQFNNSAKFDGLCFFTFSNAALYKMTGRTLEGEKHNYQSYIQFVEMGLNLEKNSMTEIELALDVNCNPVPKIRKLIKDYENYDMIVNGRRVEDETRNIEGYKECFGRSRVKINRQPTLYFQHAKDNSLKLRIYDKTAEIIESSPDKEYINEWNEFGNCKTYRLEMVIRWDDFKKWLDYVNDVDSPVLSDWRRYTSQGEGEHIAPSETFEAFLSRSEALLRMGVYKSLLWSFQAHRLVYWRHRGTNRVVTLLDVAQGADI